MIPLFLSILVAYFLIISLIKTKLLSEDKNLKTTSIAGKKTSSKGLSANLLISEKSELELIGSLADKKGLTIFGSSELSNTTNFIPYEFLPDSMGIRTNAFGHAFQQNFAIYCQLLALKQYVKNSKICIILSPGWFETEGTNIEAFLEFVRPNFLRRIIQDNTISEPEQDYIARYIFKNYNLINKPSKEINYLYKRYQYRNLPILNNFFFQQKNTISTVNYQLHSNKTIKAIANKKINWSQEKLKAKRRFIATCTSNKLFINDDYYKNHILTDNKIRKGNVWKMNKNNNRELMDFKVLVQFLKENKCQASFIIQAYNPFHYQSIENFFPILNEIKSELTKHHFPYLDFYPKKISDYEPGTLIDIMHFGDVAWIQIDKFLVETYD